MAVNLLGVKPGKPQDHKKQTRELQKAFKAAAVQAGLATSECRTVCEQRVVIGPDGKARVEWVCRVICK
jgi:hypothetical protein